MFWEWGEPKITKMSTEFLKGFTKLVTWKRSVSDVGRIWGPGLILRYRKKRLSI